MCYMVSWQINKEAFTDDFVNICRKYKFSPKHNPPFSKIENVLENSISSSEVVSFNFMGNNHCECDTPLGRGTSVKRRGITDDINDYLSLLNELQNCSKIKYITIFKRFYNGDFYKVLKQKFEIEIIHISEVDIEFLTNIEDDLIYKILYYKKWD